MTENRTRPTTANVGAYLLTIKDERKRGDRETVSAMMAAITGASPRMWGPSIVGFGEYHYKYASGREGDAALTGFSSRQGHICVYLAASGPNQVRLLTQLGPHKMGKSCLYIRKLADVDSKVLQQLIVDSIEELNRRYAVPVRSP